MRSSSRWRVLVVERILPRFTPSAQRRIRDMAFRFGWPFRLRLGIDDHRGPRDGEIDVHRVLEAESVESLAAEAERYFADQATSSGSTPARKPFRSVEEASDHLIPFCHVLMGLQLLPRMRVLDFGAGLGWTSRIFLQLAVCLWQGEDARHNVNNQRPGAAPVDIRQKASRLRCCSETNYRLLTAASI